MFLLTLNWVINTITLYILNYFIALIDQLLVVFLIHASKVKMYSNKWEKKAKQTNISKLFSTKIYQETFYMDKHCTYIRNRNDLWTLWECDTHWFEIFNFILIKYLGMYMYNCVYIKIHNIKTWTKRKKWIKFIQGLSKYVHVSVKDKHTRFLHGIGIGDKKLVVCVFLMGGRRIYCYFMSLKNIMFPDPHTVQRTSTVDTSDAIPENKILLTLFTYSWAKIYLSLFKVQ